MRWAALLLLLCEACGGGDPPPCDWCFGNRHAAVQPGRVECPCPVDPQRGSFVIETSLVSCDEGRAKYLEWLVNVCAAVP